MTAIDRDLLGVAGSRRFATLLADPPWQFTNKTGKVAPEHKRLARYGTLTLPEIMALPVEQLAALTKKVEEADGKIREAARPQKLHFELAAP